MPSFDSNTFGILVHEYIFPPHFFFLYFVAQHARIRSLFFVNITKDKPSVGSSKMKVLKAEKQRGRPKLLNKVAQKRLLSFFFCIVTLPLKFIV